MRRGLDYVGGWSYFRVNLETLENTPTFSFRATYKLISHWHILYCTWLQSNNGIVSDIGKLGARLELCQVDPYTDSSM